MTMRRPVQPPATQAQHRRPRRSDGLRQIDLFASTLPTETPAWRDLPEEARRTLTNLMTRLILDHAQAGGAASREEAGHDV
jgi:hypothetical protein